MIELSKKEEVVMVAAIATFQLEVMFNKIKEFRDLLKLKKDEFISLDKHQCAFERIKQYLTKPSVLMPLVKGIPLKLYVSATKESIGYFLAQDNGQGFERAVYYVSRVLLVTKTKYLTIEKMCLSLYFACTKLRHYLIKYRVFVMSQTNLTKYILSRLLITGKVEKWALALTEFFLAYHPQKAVKRQALADFLVDHPCLDVIRVEGGLEVNKIRISLWVLKFDDSSTETLARARIIIESLAGTKTALSFNLDF
ncbi:hypothetical protein GH714_010679 [Hevea brasiliensis]|uniref:Reverse transcriptase/retrotransposon-derived protein RNase H-like domain-containing protein n=1 Tax=Hevea brasiliensis TaxID=3981 RepID=A0A6A6MV18_HEVBR|nr:hypothetical protein GH714_010679 [Hevea brasiliensis]